MKGTNQLVLNQATMIDALQMYLEAKMRSPGQVQSVESVNGSASNGEFRVVICEKEEV